MHTLPTLNYDYSALEPYIDAKTVEIHHSKHHAGYVNKLNSAIENYPELHNLTIEQLLSDLSSIPEEIRQSVINAGGGHYNHSIYWDVMGPNAGEEPIGEIAELINAKFNSFENFKSEFSNAAAMVFGSGWAWLVKTQEGEVEIVKTSNQDSPISQGLKPLLCIDVWEHAYYLKYQNSRPDHIEAWWNLINWDQVQKYFEK